MRHRWVRSVIEDFETNPQTQFNFHRYAMYFWVANAIAAVVLFTAFRQVWDTIAVFYVLAVSLYANWDTDFDAMSASGAWMEAKKRNSGE